MQAKIPLSKPTFTEEMKNAAIAALENEFFVMGESVFKFEEEFARYTGTKHAISVNSGTSALSLSLTAFGIGKEENVLTTPMSFIATSNAIIHANGTPRFSDIEINSGNIDMNPAAFVPKGMRAVIPVHLYGNPCNVDKIRELREQGMFVIEDACQAHGAEYKGKKAGSFGDAGCFSFYSTKNMTVCGDGGMITTDNEDLAEKLKKMRDCGRITKYEHTMVGYTARLNTVNAAIGRVQLKHLDEWNTKRMQIADVYKKNLPQESMLKENGKSVYHIFAMRSKNRDALMKHLSESGIGTGVHYPIPIHLQPAYREMFDYKEGAYPRAEHFAKEIISLPMFPDMAKDDARFVCEKIQEAAHEK